MVNSVSSGGYQAYAYQAASSQVREEPRSGDNRVETRKAPAGDSNKQDPREFSSRDATAASSPQPSNDDSRGSVLDVKV